MLAIKLLLVPGFLLLISLASARWGASIAGWLSGLPVVAGPILYILSVEQGSSFGSLASSASLSAVLASISFGVVYAHVALRRRWPVALTAALIAWLLAALLLSASSGNILINGCIALGSLLVAPYAFPDAADETPNRTMHRFEISLRMFSGACITLFVTLGANGVGAKWSGLLSVFPVLGIVLAVFSHRTQGAQFACVLLRSMARGLYSFAAFCISLSIALQTLSTPSAFLVAVLVSLIVQFVSKRHLNGRSTGMSLSRSTAR